MPPTARNKPRARRGAKSMKIVVTGPYDAGKTTLIRTISEITVLSTERKVTHEAEAELKGHTTVAMDFGRLTVADDLVLHLFGTPGQRRFDFMWEILAEGMLGFVVLVDDSRLESFDDAQAIVDFFRDVAEVPYVVAVNKVATTAEKAVSHARHRLRIPDGTRVVTVDARDREAVKGVLLELLEAVLEEVEARGDVVLPEA